MVSDDRPLAAVIKASRFIIAVTAANTCRRTSSVASEPSASTMVLAICSWSNEVVLITGIESDTTPAASCRPNGERRPRSR